MFLCSYVPMFPKHVPGAVPERGVRCVTTEETWEGDGAAAKLKWSAIRRILDAIVQRE